MPNFQSYPHTSLEEACKLVPSVNVTDTVNFSLNRLKKFVLPLFCSQEDPSRVLRHSALPYSDSALTFEDADQDAPFAVRNCKEASDPRLELVNLDELGQDGLYEQDMAIIARNMLKLVQTKEPLNILLTANTLKNLDTKVSTFLLSLLTAQEFTDSRFKSKNNANSPLKSINIICAPDVEEQTVAILNATVEQIKNTFTGILYARLLGNLPANIGTPQYFAEEAQTLAAQLPMLKVSVHDEGFLKAEQMNALLAVASGSTQKPYMTVFEYTPTATTNEQPITIIGKGLTFDSGGLSLKPGAQMDEMMFDKCGAVSVFGLMYAAVTNKLPLKIIGLASFTENMPDGNSYHPGDIITTRSGRTVEVLNTDAEGRLVLADTISYAVSTFNPRLVIDIATLTGACMVALGHDTTGFFTNGAAERLELPHLLRTASELTGDTAWHLPQGKLFGQMIEARFGDLANTGGRYAGAVTAGEFLKCFAEKKPWVHLDVAGTAWVSGTKKTATGRPVALVNKLLELLAHK